METLPQFPVPQISGIIRPNNCGACKWGHRTKEVAAEQLQCRGEPPTAAIFPMQGGQFLVKTAWPVVGQDWWCGKWQPKIAQEN